MRIQDGTPPERLRRIIGRFSSNNHACILFQRMFIDKDRENALSLAKSAYNREIGRPTKPARRARALPPRARLPHRGARCGDARLSSDMNAMYAHYDAVLAGLRLRHAMSEL